MTIKRVIDFIFPVGDKTLSQDAYYRALSEAKNGFYPFGENGIWHGGIHVNDDVLRAVGRNDERIQCMANGEVIAYRVNEAYSKVTYKENPPAHVPLAGSESVAYFSSSFTLVRHYFRMPKIAGESGAPPSITLYSLYMHQLDWFGYQQRAGNSHNPRGVDLPSYWYLKSGRVSNETKDNIKGTTIRKDGPGTEQVALLLKGSQVKLGECKSKNGWYKVLSVERGQVITTNRIQNELGSIEGYIHYSDLGDVKPEKNKDADGETVYTINGEGNDKLGVKNAEKTVPGIIVYSDANGKSVAGYLSKNTYFDFDGQENGYAKIKEIHSNFIPSALINGNGQGEAPHKGFVKISNLTALEYEPQELDKVVVLDKPIAINGGDFIGYLGDNVSRASQFMQRQTAPLANEKRPSRQQLSANGSSLLGHFELFTCDDLPAFITKTKALADKLPESEKSLIVVEQGAQLVKEKVPDGQISNDRYVRLIGSAQDRYYKQVQVYYVLKLIALYYRAESVITPLSLKNDSINQPTYYRLTADDKARLVKHYQLSYPELTIANIPDEVELTHPLKNNDVEVEVRFSLVGQVSYWVESVDVAHLNGGEGQLNQLINYWSTFPLSLVNLPAADSSNTVYFGRTLPLSSIESDNYIAVDESYNTWVYITAGNEQGSPIRGWVNVSKGESDYLQPHVKRASPWEWLGFEKIEETATISESAEKITSNHKMTLDLADYTESMAALHSILNQTRSNKLISDIENNQIKKVLVSLGADKILPYLLPLTDEQFKKGLRTPWAAELIGHLMLNYESEWYADDALSKWNELDVFYQKQRDEKRQSIFDELAKAGITSQTVKELACTIFEENFKYKMDEWQIEKEHRIKPSLWWNEVATVQATTDNNQPVLAKLAVNGKAWHLHPVGMGVFKAKKCFCGRDFTVDDVKLIVKQLRLSEGINDDQLFTSKNCNLSDEDKTYERFTEELNAMMNKYNINTCLRKVHFLAQSYLESARFNTLKEYGKKLSYDPYRGRGLIQLTHAGDKEGTIGYKQYFEYLGEYDYKKDYEILNNNLSIAIDVGGYFWTRGKLLNNGDYLKSDQKLNGEWQYYKKTKLSGYTTIDINVVADNDHTEQVTFLVNGGYSHLQERIHYTNKLKEIFNYEECINKK